MMTLYERIELFSDLFDDVMYTNSRNEKESYIESFLSTYPELKEDWIYILETLAGKHPIGFTYAVRNGEFKLSSTSIKEIIEYLCNLPDRTVGAVLNAEHLIGDKVGLFIEPIVNRTLKLGIGNSLLDKSDLTPMLAKKYEGGILQEDYFISEKLDGNRCIAHYEDGRWHFTSRSGKPLKVNFDMSGIPTEYIYDGEIMSMEQTCLSIARANAIRTNDIFKMSTEQSQRMFNATSGLINSKGSKAGLVYNIFDIIINKPLYVRRNWLKIVERESFSSDVRILPTLYVGKDVDQINHLLDVIVEMGGEGIMLNNPNATYIHKRTDALLKYKQVKNIDMLVTNVYEGSGKYVGMVGSLECHLKLDDGRLVSCNVGAGFSDSERTLWFRNKELIKGKIVQVAYHEITQERSFVGTNFYSLRFPRLIKVRKDKTETSEF